jgi:hypothetical protein
MTHKHSSTDISIGDMPQPDLTPQVTARMPKLGEIVTYYQGDMECAHEANMIYKQDNAEGYRAFSGTNGSRFHAAIVTRAWSATCVNLTVFLDAKGPTLRSSATMLPDFEDGVHCVSSGWRFNDRV